MRLTDTPLYFVSYAHEDTDWRTQLFERSIPTTIGDCLVWSDEQLRGGDRWRTEIETQLGRCKVAVLLVSGYFLKSDFITRHELPPILRRAGLPETDPEHLRIVWIPIALDGATLRERQPQLAEIQGGLGFELALAARPDQCTPPMLDAVRMHVARQLQLAVDPDGAELQQRLSRRFSGLRRLGEGARALVYEAHDEQLQRTVAIKLLRDLRQRDAFRMDVQDALRTSEEPNFMMVYSAEFGASTSWCVLQHVRGRSLRSLLRAWSQPGAAQPDAALLRRLFVKLARALERAHRLGLRYGNLKPSNIVIDMHFEPFIQPVGRRPEPGGSPVGMVDLLRRAARAKAGGPPLSAADAEDLAYLVPEQAAGLEQTDDGQLADQYMLGLLAWEMATRKLPERLPDPSRLADLGLDAFEPLQRVQCLRQLFPERVDALLQRMTQTDPAERLPDIGAVLAEPDLHDDLPLVLVRDSWRRCATGEGFDQRFFQDFYTRLQQRAPAAARHLARIDSPAGWARQHRMLKHAVSLLIAFAQRQTDQAEPTLLSQVAQSHAGIPAGLYAPFARLLVDMVCGDVQQGIAPADAACRQRDTARRLRMHWQRVLAPGVDYLTAAELRRSGEMQP